MTSLVEAWRDWRERREVLRDVRRQRSAVAEWAFFRFRDAMVDALAAIDRGDTVHAAHVWHQASEQYPNQALGSPLAIDVLLGLRRFEAAEALMNEGLLKKPGESRFAIGLAETARAKGDFETAVQRWSAVRSRFPGLMQGYALGVEALRDLGRLSEAEALVQETMRRFPEEILGFMEHARLADLKQDWDQARQRWDVVRARFGHLSGYTGAAHALINLGLHDDAEALFTAARVRFPTEPASSAGLARCAEAKNEIVQAITLWKRLAQHFPMHIFSVLEAANALERLNSAQDAENVLRGAIERFPSDMRPSMALGELLLRRGEFCAASKVFAKARDAFPDTQAFYLRGIEALNRADQAAHAQSLLEEHRRRFKQCISSESHAQ